MKKVSLLFIIISLFIVFSFSVNAAPTHHYSCDGDFTTDSLGVNNFTLQSGDPASIAGGFLNNYCEFDGNDASYGDGFSNTWNNFSFCAWINITTWSTSNYFFGTGTTSSGHVMHLSNVLNRFNLYSRDGTTRQTRSQLYGNELLNKWTSICVTFSNNGLGHIYVNGVESSSYSIRDNMKPPTDSGRLAIGTRLSDPPSAPNGYMTGGLDEIRFWFDDNVSTTEMENWYIDSDDTPPAITINSPANNTKLNTDVNFSITVTDDKSSDITCTLSNATQEFDYVRSASPTLLTYTITENQTQTIDFIIECFDNDDDNNNSASINYQIEIDSFPPFITINQPSNAFYSADVPLDLSCYDDNVYILRYDLYNSSGSLLQTLENNTNISTADAGNLIIKDTFSYVSLDQESYLLNVSCSDSHTKNKIKNYNPIKDLNRNALKYYPQNKDEIEVRYISSDVQITGFGTTKHLDRYAFNFDFSNQPGSHTYVFEISNLIGLVYHPNSGYAAHFTTTQVDGNWVDFEFGDPAAVFEVTKLAENKYQVIITTDYTTLSFNSIGGLNKDNEIVQFVVCKDFICSGYSDCQPGDIRSCNQVSGVDGCLDINYQGDYSEFAPLSCEYSALVEFTFIPVFLGVMEIIIAAALVLALAGLFGFNMLKDFRDQPIGAKVSRLIIFVIGTIIILSIFPIITSIFPF